MAEAVRIEGLRELQGALRRIDRSAATELRKELRTTVGAEFVRDAKDTIAARGLVKSGRLQGSIKASVRGGDLFVRSSPALKPGPKSRQGYAPVYEFGHGGARAFLEPTRKEWLGTGKLERELTGFLDWTAKEFRA